MLSADGKGEHDGSDTNKGDANSDVTAMGLALKRRVCAWHSLTGSCSFSRRLMPT